MRASSLSVKRLCYSLAKFITVRERKNAEQYTIKISKINIVKLYRNFRSRIRLASDSISLVELKLYNLTLDKLSTQRINQLNYIYSFKQSL